MQGTTVFQTCALLGDSDTGGGRQLQLLRSVPPEGLQGSGLDRVSACILGALGGQGALCWPARAGSFSRPAR